MWSGDLSGFDPSCNNLKCLSMLPNDYLKRHDSWFTARMKQCAGKQACSMVRASVKKRDKQLYMLAKLQRKQENTKYLQRKIDIQPLVKPSAEFAKVELDPRFIDFEDGSTFDLFVRVRTIGDDVTFNIPIKHTKVSRKWLDRGELKHSIRLDEHCLTLIYEVPDVPKHSGETVGADQGYKTVLTLSDGQVTKPDKDGHNLGTIQARLSRRKKASNGFKRSQSHRRNHINWALNQLNFSHIGEVRLEKIKGLRYRKRGQGVLLYWTYPLIKQKLVSLGEVEGFRFVEVSNQFRSQRCSRCSLVCKSSRKGKTFQCAGCGYTLDADLNAASNLEIDLFEIPWWVQRSRINRDGFYWESDGIFSVGHEPIVRDTIRAVE